MITIYTITYNEEFMLPHFVKWYRDRFKDCTIVVFDNESTDNTRQIATDLGCEVITYYTDNKLDDQMYLNIKNNCWKKSETDWVIVCDCDEFLDITMDRIDEANKSIAESRTFFGKITHIQSVGYNMCNVDNLTELTEVRHGIRAQQYDKVLMFNKGYIQEINYGAGCHGCNIEMGYYSPNIISANLYHMHFMNEDLMVKKYQRNALRLSENNKINKWGYHYEQSEESIRGSYKNHLILATEIR